MDRDEFMELVYETFADEPDNVLANGIIEAADAYVEHEKAQLSQEDTTKDIISRQALCEYALNQKDKSVTPNDIMRFPSAQPEPSIPLSWIEEYIEWIKSVDNEFTSLEAAHISVMVKKWRDEQNERTD